MDYSDEELQQMAIKSIYNYYEGRYTEEYIKNNFGLAIKVLVNNAKNLMKVKISGVTQVTEGSRSISFGNNVEAFNLTSDVLALLPKKNNFRAW